MDDQVIDVGRTISVISARRGGALVVTVVGEVDLHSYEVVESELSVRLDRRPAALVVDLDRVEFFGSLGISVLLRVDERARSRRVGFAVAASRRQVVRTLEVTDTARLLPLRATLPEALHLAHSAA
jgi:anti-sigma B factor antagonist